MENDVSITKIDVTGNWGPFLKLLGLDNTAEDTYSNGRDIIRYNQPSLSFVLNKKNYKLCVTYLTGSALKQYEKCKQDWWPRANPRIKKVLKKKKKMNSGFIYMYTYYTMS